MILLKTNRPEYRNDIAEEIRLFYGQTDISVDAQTEQDCELVIEALLDSVSADDAVCASASADGLTHRETLAMEGKDALSIKRVEKRAVKIAVFRLLQKMHPTATPWGSLTGIRPTKLFRELTAAHGEEGAKQHFLKDFDVSEEKTALAQKICRVQRAVIASVDSRDADVYVNIPFCKTKCLYCSFPSQILGKADVLSPYLVTLFEDIEAGAALLREHGYHLRCMYIGGGTPTVLSAKQLDKLLSHLSACYGSLGSEITVEAGRPDTIDAQKLSVIRSHGVQRISINPQSMNDVTLERIGRAHTADDVAHAYRMARDAGFPIINMDLIAGLPGESAQDFRKTLSRVRDLDPENLTVHTLAIKRSSLLIDRLAAYPLPDAKTVETMVADGAAAAEELGMVPYYMYRQKYMSGNLENVGYAKPDSICIYNIDMMEETTSILAHGASAMSKRVFHNQNRVERIPNPKDIRTYTEKLPRLIAQKNVPFD